jgi:hypothetical protein
MAAYPDYVFKLSDAYEYKVYNGPKTFGTPVSTAVTAGAAATLALGGGTKMSIPAGAFSVPVDVSLAAIAPFKGAEPATGNAFASDLLVFNTADANGTYVAPAAPISVAMPVKLNRRRAPSPASELSGISQVSLRMSVDALLLNLSESAPPSRRRLLQANANPRGAWLDKCTGSWKVVCSTEVNKDTNAVQGDIPQSVFSDKCFNPSSGCTPAIIAVDQCEGAGGTFAAMAFEQDPCPAKSGNDNNNVGLIVGVVVGGVAALLILVGSLFWYRRKLTQEEEEDASYASSKSYSDDEEIGSQYTSRSGSYPPSPRLQIMPGSGMYITGGSPGMPGSDMYLPPPSAYDLPGGSLGMPGSGMYLPPSLYQQMGSAQPMGDPLQYMGSQYGDSQTTLGGMGLPPPVFSQGMGIGAMASGSPQGYYSGYRAPSRPVDERQM